jgi:bile acid:Na+ symporter, BASS family
MGVRMEDLRERAETKIQGTFVTLQALVLFALKASIFLSVAAVGLEATPGDAAFLLRQPSLLARSLLAMDVVMPAVVAVIVGALDLYQAVEVGLVALAVSPVPPILPKKQIKASGKASYTIGLLALSAAVAIFFIPIAIDLLGRFLQNPVHMKAWPIARLALFTTLVPLSLGILVKRFAPDVATRTSKPVALIGGILLAVSLLPVLFTVWPVIIALIGNGTILAIAAFVLLGLLVGHLLGGPDPHHRAVLALATATRHPGIALAIGAANFPDQKSLLPAILLYAILGAILTIPYVMWRKSLDFPDAL